MTKPLTIEISKECHEFISMDFPYYRAYGRFDMVINQYQDECAECKSKMSRESFAFSFPDIYGGYVCLSCGMKHLEKRYELIKKEHERFLEEYDKVKDEILRVNTCGKLLGEKDG